VRVFIKERDVVLGRQAGHRNQTEKIAGGEILSVVR
jgi:hypothetical protein